MSILRVLGWLKINKDDKRIGEELIVVNEELAPDQLKDVWTRVEKPENYESTKPIIWDIL